MRENPYKLSLLYKCLLISFLFDYVTKMDRSYLITFFLPWLQRIINLFYCKFCSNDYILVTITWNFATWKELLQMWCSIGIRQGRYLMGLALDEIKGSTRISNPLALDYWIGILFYFMLVSLLNLRGPLVSARVSWSLKRERLTPHTLPIRCSGPYETFGSW